MYFALSTALLTFLTLTNASPSPDPHDSSSNDLSARQIGSGSDLGVWGCYKPDPAGASCTRFDFTPDEMVQNLGTMAGGKCKLFDFTTTDAEWRGIKVDERVHIALSRDNCKTMTSWMNAGNSTLKDLNNPKGLKTALNIPKGFVWPGGMSYRKMFVKAYYY